MNSILDKMIYKFPKDIGLLIFRFIISDSNDIKFRIHRINAYNNEYTPKYELAFIGNKYVKNKNNQYLSRICKKMVNIGII